MSATATWLLAFLAGYTAYALFWAAVGARFASSPVEFFLAGRRLPHWVLTLAITVMSFGSVLFLTLPDQVLLDGLPAGYIAVGAVAVCLSGVLFLKRQWVIARRFGFVSPAEMQAAYYESDVLRLILVGIALLFAIPFLALQFRLTGLIAGSLSGGALDANVTMWMMGTVVVLYTVIGGLRSAAYVSGLQALMLAGFMVSLGLLAFDQSGGLEALSRALADFGKPAGDQEPGFHRLMELAGVVQFTDGLGEEDPGGGIWSTVMVLGIGLALMGVQAGPGFSMLGMAARDSRPFHFALIWVSAGLMGLMLLFSTIGTGLIARIMGIGVAGDVPLALQFIQTLQDRAPWFAALLGFAAIASLHGVAALHASTTSGMLTRDLYLRFIVPGASGHQQKTFGRIFSFFILVAALVLASFADVAAVELGGLAIACAAQLLPALAGLCWLRWITRQGVLVGLGAGIAAVVLTDRFGLSLAGFIGIDLPWGRWPWTIHSAGWGLFVNLLLCLLISWATLSGPGRETRDAVHDYLSRHASMPDRRRVLRPVAWGLTLAWFFFALGPGALIGNRVFGAPDQGIEGWVLGIPSIWSWQILAWALGVLLLWFLAVRMQMAQAPSGRIEPLHEDCNDAEGAAERPALTDPQTGLQVFWAVVLGISLMTLIHWAFG